MMAALSTGDLLRRALGWSLGHPGVLARLAAPAIVFAAILRLAIGLLWGDEIVAMVATGQPSGTAMMAGLLYGLVLVLAIALVAVAWHRYVLRGEISPFPADGATLRFALYQFWLGLLGIFTIMAGLIVLSLALGAVGGPPVLELFVKGVSQTGGLWSVLAMNIVITAALAVPFVFYGLVLPATAIGDRGLVAIESRRLLRGHRVAGLVALIGVSLLSLALSTGVSFVLAAILPAGDGFGLAEVVGEVVSLTLVAFETSIFAGVLSELYRSLRLPELARGGVPG